MIWPVDLLKSAAQAVVKCDPGFPVRSAEDILDAAKPHVAELVEAIRAAQQTLKEAVSGAEDLACGQRVISVFLSYDEARVLETLLDTVVAKWTKEAS